ncbi:MAG: antibiotic biosynthesis monooxygenase family protein [Paludibaculum sp.]
MTHLLLLLILGAAAYAETAKDRFDAALQKLNQSGRLAQSGKFAEAQPLMNDAVAEMDAAVASDPANTELRLLRGSIYGRFPAFLNKGDTAREDLEMAARDPRHRDAAERALAPLRGAAPTRRFPQISDSASPIMAVSSVTFPDSTASHREQLPALMRNLLDDMKSYEGFLGNHVLISADHAGMVVMFTWWKDKQTLARWVDGPGHQAAIREIYSHRAPTGKMISTQVAAELFLPLPGSRQFNGGLTPKEALAIMEK